MSNHKFDLMKCSCDYSKICKNCFVWEEDVQTWNPEQINTEEWLAKRHENCEHEVMIVCDYCVADIKQERETKK